MIIMKYSLSMSFASRRTTNIIERMYGCDVVDLSSLWMDMKLNRVYNNDTMMITIDEDEFGG